MRELRVTKGRDLAPKDANGLSDPYCFINYADQEGQFVDKQNSLVTSEV